MSSTPVPIPTFEQLAADPAIAALLTFAPAPRKIERPDGWTPERQRELIARIAATGSPRRAAEAMDKNISGAKHLYRSDGADGFRLAWQSAMALAAERDRARRAAAPPRPVDVPGIVTRSSSPARDGPAGRGLPGQVRNEHGEWEDEASYQRRIDDARDSIGGKLVRARRLYLQDISGSAGHRAAFEILTDLPVDWDKAARLEPQPFEPWTRTNQRQPDMILTAESGWSFGEIGYGPDRKAQARREVDAYRRQEGLEPIDWSEPAGDEPIAGETPTSA